MDNHNAAIVFAFLKAAKTAKQDVEVQTTLPNGDGMLSVVKAGGRW